MLKSGLPNSPHLPTSECGNTAGFSSYISTRVNKSIPRFETCLSFKSSCSLLHVHPHFARGKVPCLSTVLHSVSLSEFTVGKSALIHLLQQGLKTSHNFFEILTVIP